MKLGETCIHKNLKRQCETCEIADERDRLHSQLKIQDSSIADYILEIDRLKEDLIKRNAEIIMSVSEIDRLKAELEEQKIGHFKASVRADTFEMDLFTARKQHITFRDDMAKLNQEIAKDRDLWKSKAEKLAEALREIEKPDHDCVESDCNSLCGMFWQEKIAKEALVEFEKGN